MKLTEMKSIGVVVIVSVMALVAGPLAVARGQSQPATKPSVNVPAAMLSSFDTNRNGKIDPGERQAQGRALRQLRKEQLAIIDTNGDGRIHNDELATAKKSNWVENLSPASKALFKRLDTNNDGWLDDEELGRPVALGGRNWNRSARANCLARRDSRPACFRSVGRRWNRVACPAPDSTLTPK